MNVTTSSTVWLASRGTAKLWYAPPSDAEGPVPRQTLTVSVCVTAAALSGALIELGQHELAMAERLGAGEAAVAGADRDIDERVARLIQRHLAAEDAGHVEVDVLLHLARGLRVGRELDH